MQILAIRCFSGLEPIFSRKSKFESIMKIAFASVKSDTVCKKNQGTFRHKGENRIFFKNLLRTFQKKTFYVSDSMIRIKMKTVLFYQQPLKNKLMTRLRENFLLNSLFNNSAVPGRAVQAKNFCGSGRFFPIFREDFANIPPFF